MDLSDNPAIDSLLGEAAAAPGDLPAPAGAEPRRDLGRMMRKIPVTLTLEVGSARVSLQDLADIRADSVVELDTLAGEPLVIKVNGTTIGRAEVVVAGDNYALKVVELSSDLDLGSLAQ
ncbi:FliM/FliN family flagellar motor switch protein [Eleftheria terrae]|uniref:FliM/FliN family flagellar motor switch protein n=1 Tax=Eleftheria terrae TaxID=1597781 RepID=UPI00263AE560|nr:FliM/FliN family flagellar motor switch protein [Eleftheria terrae]WKB54119.1 FliM/FliN family flagellar motor switch protein [Eleftheria terrae]